MRRLWYGAGAFFFTRRPRCTDFSHLPLQLGFVTPAHAEEWDWDIGYKRPGFVHHHYRHHLSDIDRERVRLYREAELDAEHRAEHREEASR